MTAPSRAWRAIGWSDNDPVHFRLVIPFGRIDVVRHTDGVWVYHAVGSSKVYGSSDAAKLAAERDWVSAVVRCLADLTNSS